jgi:single-stranded-DNA-specific exonuclease
MDPFLEKLLSHYGISYEDYLALSAEPSPEDIPSIRDNVETKKAISALDSLKGRGGKALIYGDYDTDGIMAASIALRAFREYGIKASAYLPSRYLDGYGLTADNAEKIAKAGFSLIFTVDNGVTAIEGIGKAKSLGLQAIVLDHHEFTDRPEGIEALLHPSTLGYLDPPVSAGFLSYLFSEALLGRKDPYLLTLGAISTLSDVMPLKSYNRDIVRLGVSYIQERRFPELILLSNGDAPDAEALQMRVIPSINAVGRVVEDSSINRLLKYFAGDDPEEKRRIARWMGETNARRKELTADAADNLKVDASEPGVVVVTDLPEGLNGLLANRLMDSYKKPVAVFSGSKRDPDIYVGSIRAKEGFNVLKAIEENDAEALSSGGHAFAGGITIRKSELATFKEGFLKSAAEHPFEEESPGAIPLSEDEAGLKNLDTLLSFGPFGKGNEAPLFSLDLPASRIKFSRDGRFISTPLNGGVARLFSFDVKPDSLPKGGLIRFTVRMGPHIYKGIRSVDLLAKKAERA